MQLDQRLVAETGRAAPAALPATLAADSRPATTRLACDVCGGRRRRYERHRLVWEPGRDTRLVLADLCGGCATLDDPLLDLYGGSGREAIRLVQEIRPSPPRQPRVRPRVVGLAARAGVYLLIAIAAFFLVTLVTSVGR